ncbi:MAG TPA: hypothetical protein VE153_20820 [Myxococcus sp.]|jgi:hypothetical protein|nr:hypothetical protein [Myxococcus sp.]
MSGPWRRAGFGCPTKWSFLVAVAAGVLLTACEGPNGEERAQAWFEAAAAAAEAGDGGANTYVPPPELTNPLYLPPERLTAVQNICGSGFHYAALGECTSAVGSTFSVEGKQCTVTKTASANFGGLQHCCTSCQLNANSAFFNHLGLSGATNVQIAPTSQPGCNTPGVYAPVNNPAGVYDAITSTAGINACTTNPVDLKGKPGFIEYTAPSEVLNEGGTRSTFGYYIQFTQGGKTVTYFVLFSYDKNKDGKCATELFLFGPVTPGQTPALVMGLAIDKDGNLLTEVPLDIADVTNFLGGNEPTPVKPGITPGQGCRECHKGATGSANRTRPFPWGGTPRKLDDGGVPPPCPPEDGGVPDAGAPDAGNDAGAPDAGNDAGAPDAGADAGNDAGAADAGADAGTRDAGTRDAGTSDAG